VDNGVIEISLTQHSRALILEGGCRWSPSFGLLHWKSPGDYTSNDAVILTLHKLLRDTGNSFDKLLAAQRIDSAVLLLSVSPLPRTDSGPVTHA
jgi:hypothetical protein